MHKGPRSIKKASRVNQPVISLPDGTYVELVRSLFQTLLPATIMTFSFLAVGTLLCSETGDPMLAVLTGAGTIAAMARLTVILTHRKRAAEEALDVATARIFERRFALVYFSFAALLGMFGARAFVVIPPDMLMVVVGLLSGYGAGVAAGLSLRPWISVPSILIAIVPAVVVAWLSPNLIYQATGALFAVFVGGGIESMLSRYRSEARKITMRRQFATLARHDHLTGLLNRLSLREQFEGLAVPGSDMGTLAVHCLDLDRFKPVNDRYGHPAGDMLLKAVSARLAGMLRRSDFAARLGGDEFVIVQTGVSQPGEADLLARRLARALARPYVVGGQQITIGASVGYALSSEYGNDLERLLRGADEALCQVKREGGGTAKYEGPLPNVQFSLTA